MKIGAHLPRQGSLASLWDLAEKLGCEAFQFFPDNPRARQTLPWFRKEIKEFLRRKKKGVRYFLHSGYLINLFSPNPFILRTSLKLLEDGLQKAEKIGAEGLVFHLGSLKGHRFAERLPTVAEALSDLLRKAKRYLIFENSAGAKDLVGDKLEELRKVRDALCKKVQSKVKFCLDTAHAFEAGYDLRGQEKMSRFLNQADKILGLEEIVLWHLNDSATPLGSNRDRHADIGKGFIGLEAFRFLLNHPRLKDTPGVIETPKGKDLLARDRSNIEVLKGLRA